MSPWKCLPIKIMVRMYLYNSLGKSSGVKGAGGGGVSDPGYLSSYQFSLPEQRLVSRTESRVARLWPREAHRKWRFSQTDFISGLAWTRDVDGRYIHECVPQDGGVVGRGSMLNLHGIHTLSGCIRWVEGSGWAGNTVWTGCSSKMS